MTKTLTEQWKDMDLADEHLYYWRMPNGEVRIMSKLGVCSYKLCYDGDKIDILAPVPSYDEWKHTKAKLKKATELNCNHAYKTNKRRIQINNLKNENNQLREQLKEKNIKLNELRHQRNEANEILMMPDNIKYHDEVVEMLNNYIKKWGVK